MSTTLAQLEAFIADWRAPLELSAEVIFEASAHDGVVGAPTQVANGFVSKFGFKSIGFHWEMLDPAAEPDEPRSALGAFSDALSKDLVMKHEWLGDERALKCGEAFLGAFEPSWATILTNHIARDGGQSEGWNPISKATFEWAFVGYDREAIALLLLTAED